MSVTLWCDSVEKLHCRLGRECCEWWWAMVWQVQILFPSTWLFVSSLQLLGARQWNGQYLCFEYCVLWDKTVDCWASVITLLPDISRILEFFYWLSFFFAGWVISPALKSYMIGPMRNPDIQNLLEAFASLKRGLQCNKARSSYSR